MTEETYNKIDLQQIFVKSYYSSLQVLKNKSILIVLLFMFINTIINYLFIFAFFRLIFGKVYTGNDNFNIYLYILTFLYLLSLIIGIFLFFLLLYGINNILKNKEFTILKGISYIYGNIWKIIKTFFLFLYTMFLPSLILLIVLFLYILYIYFGPGFSSDFLGAITNKNLLLLIPIFGLIFIFQYIYMMVIYIKLLPLPWLVLNEDIFGKKAISMSKEFTKGNFWTIFIYLLLIGILALVISGLLSSFSDILPNIISIILNNILFYIFSVYFFVYIYHIYKCLEQKNNIK
ncbi:hypothetical protein [Candidatus Vampirococcus lugosii]|uniref:Glycerophosphoryl diester phosphodiesterase membrane domain-containing protein n=1 Tax=Candidatus Vampirococcus lugosii TaxID=2789015 RepID=A0ABS5QLG1_9BACT|nr:hypothetical protein [Candidatus Vampirococcus lugosii]MBS8122017.1 hypothetical protein [Candidatus Vampirococcus lugosii]